MTPDYYVRLNVVPEAEDEVIRAAYLALAKRYHPDSATSGSSTDSEERFQLITEAYEVLRDPGRRAQYDRQHGRQRRIAAQRERLEQTLRKNDEAWRRRHLRAASGWRRAAIPLVFAAGGFAAAALAFGQLKVPGFDQLADNTELAMDRIRDQELTELLGALQKTQGEAQAYQELLAQERGRSRDLEERLAAQQNAPPDQRIDQQVGHQTDRQTAGHLPQTTDSTPDATADKRAETATSPGQQGTATAQDDPPAQKGKAGASPPPVLDLTQAAATDEPAAEPIPAAEPTVRSDDAPAKSAPTTVAERSGSAESIRLVARAGLLLEQRNIGIARTVLERAVDLGSARALFLLAETYDPDVLSAWGTFGTRGDPAKAQELYSKAFAGGVREARERLNVSR